MKSTDRSWALKIWRVYRLDLLRLQSAASHRRRVGTFSVLWPMTWRLIGNDAHICNWCLVAFWLHSTSLPTVLHIVTAWLRWCSVKNEIELASGSFSRNFSRLDLLPDSCAEIKYLLKFMQWRRIHLQLLWVVLSRLDRVDELECHHTLDLLKKIFYVFEGLKGRIESWSCIWLNYSLLSLYHWWTSITVSKLRHNQASSQFISS